MGRRPCCSKEGLNRGAWSTREDKILIEHISVHGEGKWRDLPKKAGLKRCGKSCRLRWLNYLRPDIKRGNISFEEEDLIIKLHKLIGNRWSLIAGRLPGRTDNEIKNYWNTTLKKKIQSSSSQQSNPCCIQIKPKPSTPKHKQVESPSPSAQGDNGQPHQVIRTKALRCTKSHVPPADDDDAHIDLQPTPQQSPPSAIAVTDDEHSNFFLDFDVEELMAFIEDDQFFVDCGAAHGFINGDNVNGEGALQEECKWLH